MTGTSFLHIIYIVEIRRPQFTFPI